jgi:hypothetical protein
MLRRRGEITQIRADVHVRFIEALKRVEVREADAEREQRRALARAASRKAAGERVSGWRKAKRVGITLGRSRRKSA